MFNIKRYYPSGNKGYLTDFSLNYGLALKQIHFLIGSWGLSDFHCVTTNLVFLSIL